MMNQARYGILEKVTFFLLFLVILIFGLIAAKPFIVPLFLGVLLTYLLYPIGRFLEDRKVPRAFANVIAILVAAGVIVLAINFLSYQFGVFMEDFPEIEEQAGENLQNMRDELSSAIGIEQERFKEMEKDLRDDLFEASEQIKPVFSATTSTLVNIGLMPVFIFCFLFYRNKFHDFIIMMVPHKNKDKTEHILGEINLVTRKYMTGVVLVVTILSIVHSVTFMIIGLDYPIFFGVTAALFNFIPYFGTLIGAVLPLAYAFLAMEGSSYAVAVLIYFIIIQFVENNILTPNITGGYVNLNPFVTIVSLILGSMIWGVMGMLLIIPIIAMIKITCENILSLKPVGFLLSDRGTEKHALNLENIKKLFSKRK